MNISWLFEIGDYKFSTEPVTFSAVDYSAKIDPKTFGGIQMGWDIAGGGLIYPSDLDFDILNIDGALTRADIEGQPCTIKLIVGGALCRTWKFYVESAVLSYGKIKVYCAGILQKYLTGDYPNTPRPRETWVSVNHEVDDDDDYRIPVIFGTAYIPLMYVYHAVNETGYYVLGADEEYTIDKIKAPAESSSLVWESDDYTFSQLSDAGYKLAQFGIVATETTGLYENGTWNSSYKPLVQFSKTTGSTTAPSDIISAVLQDFGVPAVDIDTDGTFATASALFETQGIAWNGGFYEVEDRETILSSLLVQCDSTLCVSDKIELHPFSKTSQETFDTPKTILLSYSPSKITKSVSDSLHVSWAEDGYPQNTLSGKTLVPADTTTDDPDRSTLELDFIGDSVVAQKLGTIHAQRKLGAKDSIGFSTTLYHLETRATLKPADVITVDDTLLGGAQDMVISGLYIKRDGSVDITGRTYTILQEFDDIETEAIDIEEDTTEITISSGVPYVAISGEPVFKYAAEATIPDTTPIVLTATLSSGLSSFLWQYWTGTAWADLSGTIDESTYSLAHDSTEWGSNFTLLIRCKSGTVSGMITMTKVIDGTPGIDASNWSSSIVFSSVDYNTVGWADGHIYTADTDYSITGNAIGVADMLALTAYYIYLKPSVSTTELQVTTVAENSVGLDQILVAVAYPSADIDVSASFQAYGGRGGLALNADSLVANCITTAQLAAGCVTAEIVAVDTLSELAEDMGIVVSGVLSNSSGANYIDLDATGTEPLIKVGSALDIKANGDAEFAGTIKSSIIDSSVIDLADCTLKNKYAATCQIAPSFYNMTSDDDSWTDYADALHRKTQYYRIMPAAACPTYDYSTRRFLTVFARGIIGFGFKIVSTPLSFPCWLIGCTMSIGYGSTVPYGSGGVHPNTLSYSVLEDWYNGASSVSTSPNGLSLPNGLSTHSFSHTFEQLLTTTKEAWLRVQTQLFVNNQGTIRMYDYWQSSTLDNL